MRETLKNGYCTLIMVEFLYRRTEIDDTTSGWLRKRGRSIVQYQESMKRRGDEMAWVSGAIVKRRDFEAIMPLCRRTDFGKIDLVTTIESLIRIETSIPHTLPVGESQAPPALNAIVSLVCSVYLLQCKYIFPANLFTEDLR